MGSPTLSQEQKDSAELKAERVTPVGDISLSPLSSSQAHYLGSQAAFVEWEEKASRICLVEQDKKINVFIPKFPAHPETSSSRVTRTSDETATNKQKLQRQFSLQQSVRKAPALTSHSF